ncbi:helix-turn-helix domain-containing protein [Actinocrispum wychmicini]
MSAVLVTYVKELVRHAGAFRAGDSARLAMVALDLVAAWCAHELDATGELSPETRHRALFVHIQDFIERNLADRTLAPDTIAAAHYISTRHLHHLFQQQGVTVVGSIRQRRLERCRRDLADPRLAGRPIHAIAARWAFADKAHFSRLFRARYGVPPSHYRRRGSVR